MTDNSGTEIRKQLLLKGYKILPNKGKIPAIFGWNTPIYLKTELTDNAKGTVIERVARWARRFPDATSTGIRIEDGIIVIDIDVDDVAMVDSLLTALAEIAPEVHARAPTRYGGGQAKIALFAQLAKGEESFVRLSTRKYGDEGFCVEVFGGKKLNNGNCSRQFGVYGPHSFNEDGSIAVEYDWSDKIPALHEVSPTDLPIITRNQIAALLGKFDELAIAAGWEPAKQQDTSSADAVYDITEDTRFDTNTGCYQISYEELCDEYAIHGEGLRCSSNFMPGRGDSGKPTRCIVGDQNRHGCVAVYVFGDEVLHYPVQYAPRQDVIHVEQLQASMVERTRPPRPSHDAELGQQEQWLLECYGLLKEPYRVVELFEPTKNCTMVPKAFYDLYAWMSIPGPPGPRGGRTARIRATDSWGMSAGRTVIRGMQMRPDMPFPVFSIGNDIFKNTYQRPRHEGRGDIGLWLDFTKHLLPDAVEREWFHDWLAHKQRHPHIPGVACVMVAGNAESQVQGTGRGKLGNIIEKLLGEHYTRSIDFEMLSGATSQAAFTSWRAETVFVVVDEAKTESDSTRWGSRNATYERLKGLVEPSARRHQFAVKGKEEVNVISFTSYLIMTNHTDALQLPKGDRRFAVINNGEKLSSRMAQKLDEWTKNDGNIAELARWLEARDISRFDAYQPPETKAKNLMVELAITPQDEAWETVRKAIPATGMFTTEQIVAAVQVELGDMSSGGDVRRWVQHRVKRHAKRVNNFRMPPAQGRHWILCWHDFDLSTLPAQSAEAAQKSVMATGRALNEGENTLAATILNLKP